MNCEINANTIKRPKIDEETRIKIISVRLLVVVLNKSASVWVHVRNKRHDKRDRKLNETKTKSCIGGRMFGGPFSVLQLEKK